MLMSEQVQAGFLSLVWSWNEFKLFLEASVSFSPDALHVLAGVFLLLALARLMDKPVGSWMPWGAVFVLAFLNELADLLADRWPKPEIQYGQGFKDLLLTMALPTMLLLAVRLAPALFERQARAEGRTITPSKAIPPIGARE